MLSVFKRSIVLQRYGVKYKGFLSAELTTNATIEDYETFHRALDLEELNIGDKTIIRNKVVTITDKVKSNKMITYYTDQFILCQDPVSYAKAISQLLERMQNRKGKER